MTELDETQVTNPPEEPQDPVTGEVEGSGAPEVPETPSVPSTPVEPDPLVVAVCELVGDSRLDSLAPIYLRMAQAAIVTRLWPYDQEKGWNDVPERHHMLAVEIAVYLINKRGAEGESSHSESGVSRTYESASIPPSMLRSLTPFVGVISK